MDKNPKRKPNRLPLFDYGQNGVYFITICTHNKQNLFWKCCRDNPCGCPNDPPIVEYTLLGQIAIANIKALEERFPIKIENFVVMPNHIHLLLYLENFGERTAARAVPTIPQIVGAYKSIVSTQYLLHCKGNNTTMGNLWQRSYFDHIIRNEKDFRVKWIYIENNIAEWTKDEYY